MEIEVGKCMWGDVEWRKGGRGKMEEEEVMIGRRGPREKRKAREEGKAAAEEE